MNGEFKDYYRILGVTPRATQENIRRAAERELNQYWNNAIGRLQIQEAYEVLSDPDRRKEYDIEFSKRLSERERAMRNATSYAEQLEAMSLHPELAHVDIAPELTPTQEEMIDAEINNQNVGENGNIPKQPKEEVNIDSTVGSELNESSVENTESTQGSSEENPEQENEEVSDKEQEEISEKEQEENPEQENEEVSDEEQEEISDKEQEEVPEKEQEEVLEQESEEVEEQEPNITVPVVGPVETEKVEKESELVKMGEEKNVKKVIDKKQILKNAALIGIPFAIGVVTPLTSLGILGSIVATVVLAKKGKLKLQKVPKSGRITKVQTGESKIIEEYNEILEAKIREILNKPLLHNQDSYELQIAQLKYQNQLEILEKRIEFKLNESRRKGGKAFNKLQILALQYQHQKIAQKLQVLYENKGEITNNNAKNDKLTNLHRDIAKTNEELDKIDNKIQQAQAPFLEAIRERRKKQAQTKDEREFKRLEEEIKFLNSRIPQADQILDSAERIKSSNLRIQINLLNSEKEKLIDRMVSNSNNIAKQQLREAEEIEHSRTR